MEHCDFITSETYLPLAIEPQRKKVKLQYSVHSIPAIFRMVLFYFLTWLFAKKGPQNYLFI